MSVWRKIIERFNSEERDIFKEGFRSLSDNDKCRLAFVDTEVGVKDQTIHDIGAVRDDNAVYHGADIKSFFRFVDNVDYLCGHNIIHHDSKFIFKDRRNKWILVDTLYLSPILFPQKPYHRLVKDDKLVDEQANNPVNDCRKAKALLDDEIDKWNSLNPDLRKIFTLLLAGKPEFDGFLSLVKAKCSDEDVVDLIKDYFAGKICTNADIADLVENHSYELAYALALLDLDDNYSLLPRWVLYNFPEINNILHLLRHTHCLEGCVYCNKRLDVVENLRNIFGFESFRSYEGQSLQQQAAEAATKGESLLAIFPTGGGKSLTFQLPAFISGRAVRGLTVVISPLQSLMKDQVDNLANRGITEVATINGLLDPLTRSSVIKRVIDGDISLLYISPEMLRSKTIENILLARNVVRFVIDEAHCFSAWGQDFRVDYLYIGKFIKEYVRNKHCNNIPVSCFTATAKQKVIQDICDYFKEYLDVNLHLFATNATRTNLSYSVIHTEDENDKYQKLRSLIAEADCPTIVYVSRTKRTLDLSKRLTIDGFPSLPFNGKMSSDDKTANQEAFMSDRVSIIVATSAFGMGVDKSDVGLVVHYDISDSLENYVQEAGRAGRDPKLFARCYVLYSDGDLDKHFILLNQTKLSISEIQQVWSAIKFFTKSRPIVNCSALEIARQAGWDDSVSDIETRVRTAIAALEQSGYLERGSNIPHVYATGITVKNMDEARLRITKSRFFSEDEAEFSIRIIKHLISQKYIARAQDIEAESRIDYLADILGMSKRDVISSVERMKQEGVLANTKDITAYLMDAGASERKSLLKLDRFAKLEDFILCNMTGEAITFSYKEFNDSALKNGISTSNEKDIKTLLYFLTIKGYTTKRENAAKVVTLQLKADLKNILERSRRRLEICHFAIEWLYNIAVERDGGGHEKEAIQFSVVELYNKLVAQKQLNFDDLREIQLEDVEEALLYLNKIGALKLEGGFLVLYNAMNIRRIKEPKTRYKIDDYRRLNEFYKQKIQQIHIVGEFANIMTKDYDAALLYVKDYFQLDYKKFIAKYFKGERTLEIQRNLSPEKYDQLFGILSKRQMEIISDKDSRFIVVAAGPGSGKTRVLVHKLASLLLLEDVKHEQLLMLTFSRAAATEFKQRLIDLIGNAAHFVEIRTFHSYCFDLLGRIGSIDESEDIVEVAVEKIKNGEVEPNRICKSVLVIDEAQDMSESEYNLVQALIEYNADIRVIAVGDDDQNIYEFRGSNSEYMTRLAHLNDSKLIEMTDNYRSAAAVVDFANCFVESITNRIKTSKIISKTDNAGTVELTQYNSKHIYLPLVRDLLNRSACGKTCVLTRTNAEAAIILALLRRNGINAKLVHSLDGFPFWNLAEVRYFYNYIESKQNTPIINDSLWEEAKNAVTEKYYDSTALPYVLNSLTTFEKIYNEKYSHDLKEFLYESSVENFCDISDCEITVSTIHKSKGMEFDNVYLLISGDLKPKDSDLRSIYVAITRAKKHLYIHTNNTTFNPFLRACTSHKIDKSTYDMPDEVTLQLSHKDLNLGFSKDIKVNMRSIRSGCRLDFRDSIFYNPVNNMPVAKLSKKMCADLEEWYEKGYRVCETSTRFVVAWRPKDTPKSEGETAVLLTDIKLSREAFQ